MKNLECDIVKDLIPSYADGICSEATKQYVEEHIASCEGCRRMLEACRNNALTSERLEKQGFDGLKKIRQKLKIQNMLCYLVLVFLVYCGIEVFFANHVNYIIFTRPSLLLAICILANILASMGYKGKNSPGKLQYLLGGISFVLDLYLFLMFFYTASQMIAGAETFFGLELMRTGPFLDCQLIAAFAAQLAFFVYNLWCIIKQDRNCGWLLNLNMSGIFLMIHYDLWLKHMDNFETLIPALTKDSLSTAVIGAIGIIASLVINQVARKKTP